MKDQGMKKSSFAFRLIVFAAIAASFWSKGAFALDPHFYQTYWFYILCAACLTLIGAAVFRLRVKQMKARERKLVRLVLERTHQLEEANRTLQRLSYLDGLTGI